VDLGGRKDVEPSLEVPGVKRDPHGLVVNVHGPVRTQDQLLQPRALRSVLKRDKGSMLNCMLHHPTVRVINLPVNLIHFI
jgi:hypothetical protein